MKKKLLTKIAPLLLVIALAGGAFGCSGAATTTVISPYGTVTTPAATTPATTAPTTTATAPATTVAPTTTTATAPVTAANTTALDETTVRAFADSIVTSMMQGLSEGDYNKYVANADAQFKAALTEAAFQKVVDSVKSQIGTFQSAAYQSWQMQQGYIVVHYKATYSGGTVGVKIVFDSAHLVAGQFFE